MLLDKFCFREAADLANALALLLTGLTANHFTRGGKPVALIDGNQPGLGKTLLVRVVGMILDGTDPQPIHYPPDDEELQKRICATLRTNRQSVLLIDNAKSPTGTPISSPVIEANSMAPEISLRVLGVSQNFVRPNDVLWALTMNQTRVSPDLVSRGLPIRLEYAGDPRKRAFDRTDPVAYARTYRTELLAELAGFVVRWSQQGQPRGEQAHRLHHWAGVLGGIMSANGFPEFLTNYDEAANTFNAELEELGTLAEFVLADPVGPFRGAARDGERAADNRGTADRATPASKWCRYLEQAGALGDVHAKGNGIHAKGIAAGKYLSTKLGRTVPVTVNGRTGRAALHVAEGRSREKRYWFEVVWDDTARPEPVAQESGGVPALASHPPDAPTRPEALATEPSEVPQAARPAVKDGNREAWE